MASGPDEHRKKKGDDHPEGVSLNLCHDLCAAGNLWRSDKLSLSVAVRCIEF